MDPSTVRMWLAAAEGGIIGDGRTGANLALAVGAVGVVLGWWAVRSAGRAGTGGTRGGAVAAVAAGAAGVALGVLHLVTVDGGPGTGNGMAGALVAVPLGLAAVVLGRRASARSGRVNG
ncbi:DUF6223 family protein [Streptomyces sp. MJP52]|uniref:DUF6223 family protein n=1 Tax=Streptomyces sp. MJP52 TaxID=2940555 RepID=UPI00247397FD|nr:DUF6223 family protein [Streptomyces sp. MJP52]MDH6224128.1 hypothetical protein [Streptomyces sp. MJP52]